MLPAEPCPEVFAETWAPSLNESEAALISMLPPNPIAPAPTLLKMSESANKTESLALILTFPALPRPEVLANT
jgi:hypothetical protein